jgi:hypothetical protein
MIFELQMKLTTPWLGDVVTHEKIRRFRRYRGGEHLEPDAVQWRWAVKQAAESLRLNIHADTVQVPAWIKAPTLRLYTRKLRKAGKGQLKTEDFEMIDKGAVLTIHLQVHSDLPRDKSAKGPSRAELLQLFTFVGRFIGLSPFGTTFDYGRFDVLNVRALEKRDELPSELYYR